jgi:hypothetical protein
MLQDHLLDPAPTEQEKKELELALLKANEFLLGNANKLRDLFDDMSAGKPVKKTTKALQITMPDLYWDAYFEITNAMALKREIGYDENDSMERVQKNVEESLDIQNPIPLLASQSIIDTVMQFLEEVIVSQVKYDLQDIVNKTPEQIRNEVDELLKQFEAEDGKDDPDDSN